MVATNLANILWYFAEGLKLRNLDQNIDDIQNLIFSIYADEFDIELKFIKSVESGRWWLKIPTETGEMNMACSVEDYQMACENKFSKKIIKAMTSVV